ncbi:ATP-binding protein [Streptomyces sp. NPDC050610]|uniref:ATP-binding protein n=1 Tax=Streptomyces sp. NPDC050610 TaxID=3157097 RepID=UPI00342A8288
MEGDIQPYLKRRLRRADLSAVSDVRQSLREMLREWGVPGQADIAELLTSELVANALVHTGDGAVVTAAIAEGPDGFVKGRLRVEVRDFMARRPTLRAAAHADDTSGRGLQLVHTLSDAWGVRAHGVGKAVWFELNGGPA